MQEGLHNLPAISTVGQLVIAGGLGSEFLGLQENLRESLGLSIRVS